MLNNTNGDVFIISLQKITIPNTGLGPRNSKYIFDDLFLKDNIHQPGSDTVRQFCTLFFNDFN